MIYILVQGEGLRKALPPNVQILTLEPWKDDSVLLRLEHLFEIGEAGNLSQPVEVNIQVRVNPITFDCIRKLLQLCMYQQKLFGLELTLDS